MAHAQTVAIDTTAANAHINDGHREGEAAGSSLPASPTSILAGTKSGRPAPYQAPPIPHTIRESLRAYFKTSDSAAPELFLYRNTGYFNGATLNNASNVDLKTAFNEARSDPPPPSSAHHGSDAVRQLQAALHSQSGDKEPTRAGRATVGTHLAEDGKVGSIRMIDIGSESASSGIASWFRGQSARMLNMLEIGTPQSADQIRADAKEEKLVLLHGYGAGTAFYFQNLRALARHPNSRLYALDWLGMGRSSRVPFHISHQQAKTVDTRVEAAESFFVQSLEDWRKKMGLEKMTLVGHSLGAYLSIAYSLKYPQRVNRLVLLSPAGIGEPPAEHKVSNSSAQNSNNKDADKIAAEVQQSREDVAPKGSEGHRDASRIETVASASKRRGSVNVEERIQSVSAHEEEDAPKPPRLSSRRRAIIQTLWDANLSPFAILRGAFFFGPMLTGSYTRRRFASLPDEDLRSLHAYCYGIFTDRGSSEYCLAHILAPFAYARKPMESRVAALPSTLPVTFIYGERGIDWMDEEGGRRAIKRMEQAGNPNGRVFAVPHAGHHVYLDNPRAFDTLLGRVLQGKVDDAARADPTDA